MAKTQVISGDIRDSAVTNVHIIAAAGIDATKIGGGQVSSTEFDFLNGVGSQVVGTTDTREFSNKTMTGTTNVVTATYIRNVDGSQTLVSGVVPSAGWTLTASSATVAAWTAPAAGLSTSNFVFNEIPSGTPNGVLAVFGLANTASSTGSIKVYKNGLRQLHGASNDVVVNTTGLTFNAGNIPQTNDNILVDYMK